MIAENMLTQVDSDGFTRSVMKGIVDYKKDPDSAVNRDDRWVYTHSGQCRLRKTTTGWKLLVVWNDGSETWIPLKDMKESHPVETAEFAKARGISDEPAFAWWFPIRYEKGMSYLLQYAHVRGRLLTSMELKSQRVSNTHTK